MDAFIGEIRMFCGNYAPNDWFFCNGQLLSVVQYQALYAVLGNIYGGTANQSFQLPNLQGRVPLNFGTGPGLTPYTMAQTGGATQYTLNNYTMPLHTHTLNAAANLASQTTAENALPATNPGGGKGGLIGAVPKYITANPDVQMGFTAIQATGVPSPAGVSNVQPSLAVNFIICAYGEFPVPTN